MVYALEDENGMVQLGGEHSSAQLRVTAHGEATLLGVGHPVAGADLTA